MNLFLKESNKDTRKIWRRNILGYEETQSTPPRKLTKRKWRKNKKEIGDILKDNYDPKET